MQTKHPPGLRTLFFTEMWERFSYYGMRAILTLFMLAPIAAGGMGLPKERVGDDLRDLHLRGVPARDPRRLARRQHPRSAQVRLLGRVRDHDRSHPARAARDRDLLRRARVRRHRNGPPQAQHQRDRRAALRRRRTRAARPGSRSSTWGSTSARSSRRSCAAGSRRMPFWQHQLEGWGLDPAELVALGIRRSRRRHVPRTRPVLAHAAATSATPA